MLEVGAIIYAGREQHHGGVAVAARRHVLQDGEQVLRVVIDRPDANRAEEIREGPLHRHAILEQVGDAGGAAAIVLEHVIGALPVAHEIAAANVDIDVLRRREAHHLGPEMLRAFHVLARDLALLDDALAVVNILEEEIQRQHALLEAGFQLGPFGSRDDPRHQVEGENTLRALFVGIDSKGNALAQECGIDCAATLLEFFMIQAVKTVEERGVVGSHLTRCGEHLVEKIAGLVGIEQRHG